MRATARMLTEIHHSPDQITEKRPAVYAKTVEIARQRHLRHR
jgi:hypothetical protein